MIYLKLGVKNDRKFFEIPSWECENLEFYAEFPSLQILKQNRTFKIFSFILYIPYFYTYPLQL